MWWTINVFIYLFIISVLYYSICVVSDDKLAVCCVAHGTWRRIQGKNKEPRKDERQEVCRCRTWLSTSQCSRLNFNAFSEQTSCAALTVYMCICNVSTVQLYLYMCLPLPAMSFDWATNNSLGLFNNAVCRIKKQTHLKHILCLQISGFTVLHVSVVCLRCV